MKIIANRFGFLALLCLFLLSSCNEEDSPETIEGQWEIYSLHLDSEIEFHERGTSVTMPPCFYNGEESSPRNITANRITLNPDRSGFFQWADRCVDAESFNFTWSLTNSNELMIDQEGGATWVWNIDALTAETFEVEFYRERPEEGLSVGPATVKEDFTLTLRRIQ